MHLHQFKFLRRHFSLFVQNFFIDSDLSDIMKGRGYRDQILILPGQMVFVRFLHQPFQKHTGQLVDVFHMQSAFSVSKFHDLAQNTYHDPVIFFFLIDLICNQCDQPPLFRIQFDRVKYSLVNDFRIKRTTDIVRHAHLISTPDALFGIFTRDHDHRHILDPVIFVHIVQYLKTVHSRHHNIQKNQ